MRIEFVGKNYEVSDKFKAMAEKKLARLDKFFAEETDAKMAITHAKHTYKTELTIFVGGKIIRAEEISDSPFDNLDRIIPKIDGQIRKHRTVISKKYKDAVIYPDDLPLESDEPKLQIVKTKTFYLRPMNDEDAVSELELLDQSFYIYLDEATMKVKVAYKRNDGNIGIIFCEVDKP